MITFLIYTTIISIEETFAFSGYYVLPRFLLNWVARRTELHLAHGGKTHFGRWGVVDLVVGTGWYGSGSVAGWGDDSRGAESLNGKSGLGRGRK